MTTKSILNAQVSCFRNYYTSDSPKTVNLLHWLKSAKYAKEVDLIRSISDKKERDKEKAKLPAITPGGLFSHRSTENLTRFSGLMQLDIDLSHNPCIRNFDDLKKLVGVLPYVAYCGASVSGFGYWLLVPIQDADKYKDHFEAVEHDWKEVAGIVIDPNRKDITGLRGYSYDSEAYFNHNATFYTKIIPPQPKQSTPNKNSLLSENADIFDHAKNIVEGDGIAFLEGYRHNYLLKFCQLLNRFGISQDEAETWIFNNLAITPQEIKSNCISHPYENGQSEHGMYQTVFVSFDSIEEYNEKTYRIRQSNRFHYLPKSRVSELHKTGCFTQRFIVDNPKQDGEKLQYTVVDFKRFQAAPTNVAPPQPYAINEEAPQIYKAPEKFTRPEPTQPEIWQEEITELENYFARIALPTQSIKLNGSSTIVDVSKFIEWNLSIVNAQNGKPVFKPYLERLQVLKKHIYTNH